MTDVIFAFLLGAVLASALIDRECENITKDRCTFGVPNP
jgi:hypothetical protein